MGLTEVFLFSTHTWWKIRRDKQDTIIKRDTVCSWLSWDRKYTPTHAAQHIGIPKELQYRYRLLLMYKILTRYKTNVRNAVSILYLHTDSAEHMIRDLSIWMSTGLFLGWKGAAILKVGHLSHNASVLQSEFTKVHDEEGKSSENQKCLVNNNFKSSVSSRRGWIWRRARDNGFSSRKRLFSRLFGDKIKAL